MFLIIFGWQMSLHCKTYMINSQITHWKSLERNSIKNIVYEVKSQLSYKSAQACEKLHHPFVINFNVLDM